MKKDGKISAKKPPKIVAEKVNLEKKDPEIILDAAETIYNDSAAPQEEILPIEQILEQPPPEIPETIENIPMIPDKKGEIIPGQLKKWDNQVHTVLIVKDGSLDVGDISDLEKKNYFYRIHSKVPGFALIDYDKTDMVPIVKDILNRQNTFIEIRYLKFILILCAVLVLGLTVVGLIVPHGQPNFDGQKAEILGAVSKLQNLIQQQQQEQSLKATIKTTQTKEPVYVPVKMEESIQNIHKNTPSDDNQ